MDTKTFLSRVSASTDELVISLWKADPNNPTGIFWNRGSFKDIDDAVAAIQMWDRDPDWTVYYTVGRMANHAYTKENGKPGFHRRQQDATVFKVLCFDMDIGKKYATQNEGHKAVVEAIHQIGLPDPMVINSGRGIHYYWPLLTPVPKDEWEIASIALRMALDEHQVQIDTSKIHDASMVLRPVGTHHKKQVPWREVKCMADCPDYDFSVLKQTLSKWVGKSPTKSTRKAKPSAVSQAILRNCNLNIRRIGAKCRQIGALLASGGEFDAMGQLVSELMWRGGLGLAVYATDPEEAMILLSGKHPDFDHAENMAKMEKWATAPTTCAYFAQHCPGGCIDCEFKGIVSPVSLNEEVPSLPPEIAASAEVAQATAQPEFELPNGYYIAEGKVYQDVEVEVKDKDADGKTITRMAKQKKLMCPYEIHVLGIYADIGFEASSARLAIDHGNDGWKIHDVPIPTIMQGGKEFISFLANKQLFVHSESLVFSTRTFLVKYLDKVKQLVASGRDFDKFGWHENVFICGNELIGVVTNASNRVRGSARMYTDKIRKVGNRDTWAEATKLIDLPHAEHLGVGVLSACIGAFGNVSGLSTMTYSFYAPQSGTGKTLALMLGSSTYMNPDDKLMLHPTDTDNAIYNALGLLGDLSGALDELTIIDDDKRATDMAFRISQGTDKKRLDINAEQREPVTWNAPVRISTNKSLYDLYDAYMSNSEPARARTLEFLVDTQHFVEEHGKTLANLLKANYGWAIPELVQEIIDLGGKDAVWHRGHAAFVKTYKFKFAPTERYWETACVGCYIAGKIGQSTGLFRFDVDRIINYMLARIVELRSKNVLYVKDALDDIGQFMQEFNHQMVVCREEAGSKQPKVQFPVPTNACMRMDILYDAKTAVLPGSELVINTATLKWWAKRQNDSYTRLLADLDKLGVVIDKHRRVTMFRGCQQPNPGQAFCVVLDLMHPRLAVALNNGKPIIVSSPAMAVLQPIAANAVP